MTPQKALEQLRRCAHGYCDTCVHNDENCHDRIEKNVRTCGAEMIKAAEQKDGWIPCEVRMPNVNECYLVAIKSSNGQTQVMTDYFNSVDWMLYRESVIAWQPLPQPYKP